VWGFASCFQVHNALGFSLFNDGRIDRAIAEYEKAVKLQPGYVTAWNNLGNAYEKKKNLPKALKAYEQALFFDPNNSVAKEYGDAAREKLRRLSGVPVKYDD
jgi:tetratricopeptide (TPR) repeat protein